MIPNLYREMAYVTRWGIFRRSKQQSVAEHSYFVALYAGRIANELGWGGNHGLLYECALIHDLFEGRSGDIPAPFKRAMQMDGRYMQAEWDYFKAHFPHHLEALATLREDGTIKAIVRLADRLEGCIFLATEWFAGNRNAGRHLEPSPSPARDMFLSLMDAWGELDSQVPQPCANIRDAMQRAIMKAETMPPEVMMANQEPAVNEFVALQGRAVRSPN